MLVNTSLLMEVNLKDKFEEVYNLESDAIFRFCLVRVPNRHQALDITQETFLRFWKTLQSGKKIENDKAFLFTVSRRLIIDWYRKKKSLSLEGLSRDGDETLDFEADNTKTDDLMMGAEGRYLVSKINQLTDKNRDILYLRFIEDLSPLEIGKIFGISANAASVRINRGLEELRKISKDI